MRPLLRLLLASFIPAASAYVYTCNEIERLLNPEVHDGDPFLFGTQACVLIPAGVSFPFNDEPYTSYLYNTYLRSVQDGQQFELSGFLEDGTFCREATGPWVIDTDNEGAFACSSEKWKYAEIVMLFTSEKTTVVRAGVAPSTATYSKGRYTFVAPEGSLLIEKNSIKDGKETTLHFFTGVGNGEIEEKYSLAPEKFVAGTSTVIIGPVTTMEIEEDVEIELTISSFQDTKFISAPPGFEYSLMSSGRANDLQSSRPSIVVSTAFGINDDTILYDPVSVTGTVKADDRIGTSIEIDCFNAATEKKTVHKFNATSDLILNDDCTTLEITYSGSIDQSTVGRSEEVIYLRVSSNADPIHKPGTDETPFPADSSSPAPPPTAGPLTSRRTARPTTRSSPLPSFSSTAPASTTPAAAAPTTSAAAARTAAAAAALLAAASLLRN